MRKIITILCFMISGLYVYTQAPEKMNYQAVLRNSSGVIEPNKEINLNIKIRKGTTAGTEVFSENHTVTTNEFGLINIEIGSVNPTDFSDIEWTNGPFFIETSIDGSSLGISQILSVPYALYSNRAKSAETAYYANLSNLPDFTSWDTTAADDFDGQYSSLKGAPEALWIQKDSNIYYSSGSVGINISDPTDFGGAALYVGGGIQYEGLPTKTTPGLLFYDTIGDGSFKYYDNTGAEIALGTGDITYTGSYTANVSGDIIKPNDYIVQGSMEVGFDAVNGYSFGFNTMVFAENNLRILFDDTDTQPGYPNNDWQIEINESTSGGTSHFAINDKTSSKTPFKIMAGAPSNSIFIASDGNVGIGTNLTTSKLSVNGNIKANSFIGDGSGITGITGATGGISNADNTFIAADTNADGSGEISLKTQNTTRMVITNEGKIGIGISNPSYDIEVNGTGKFKTIAVDSMSYLGGIVYAINNDNTTGPATLDYDVSNKSIITLTPTSGAIVINGFISGEAGQEIILMNLGSNTVTLNHNESGTQKIFLAGGSNLVLNSYYSATLVCDGTAWYCTSINN